MTPLPPLWCAPLLSPLSFLPLETFAAVYVHFQACMLHARIRCPRAAYKGVVYQLNSSLTEIAIYIIYADDGWPMGD